MKAAVACALLLQVLSTAVGKYVYVGTPKTWNGALQHCRKHHTDLATAHSRYEMGLMYRVAPHLEEVWIGLRKVDGQWQWSAGGKADRFYWAASYPRTPRHVVMYNYTWRNKGGLQTHPFVCFNVTLVRERKTWEAAVKHCRTYHQDLASVVHPIELQMIQTRLDDVDTEAVWSGLRFLFGHWVWVDGRSVRYEHWRADCNLTCTQSDPTCTASDPTCPQSNLQCPQLERCGGFREKQDEASIGGNTVIKWEWEAYNCVSEFYFICY